MMIDYYSARKSTPCQCTLKKYPSLLSSLASPSGEPFKSSMWILITKGFPSEPVPNKELTSIGQAILG